MTHRFPLGGTSWSVWRDALLRTTGFPAAGLDRLTGPECAAVADAYLAGSADLGAFQAQYAVTATECSTELNRIAAEPLLREAITWQNPAAVQLLDSLQRSGPPGPRNSKRRYRELQLTRYWQRYSAKTETIGFFGPGCWITLDPDADTVTAEPGPALLDKRRVFLEPWVLEAYGALLAEDPATRVWLPPAPIPHHVLDGRWLRRHGLPAVELSTEEAATLALCTGRRPAVRIAEALVADPSLAVDDVADGYRVLEALVRRKLLKWDANLPLGPLTDPVLEARIDAIGDDELREKAREGLRRLKTARDQVTAATGDPEALAAAMSTLDSEFVDITGREPRRRHGQAYAGRGLCYEDTTRDLRVVIGRRLVDGIAPPLAVMAQAARWLTSEVARAYEDALQKLFIDLPAGETPPNLGDFWYPAIKLFWADRDRPMDQVVETLHAKWSALFDLPSAPPGQRLEYDAADLLRRAAEIFPADRPGWSLARIHSPDLHVCAPSAEAIDNGDYLAVLGEMHIAYSTLCDRWCTWSREDPGGILALAIQDFGQHRIVPLFRPLWSKDAGRTVMIEDTPTDRYIGFGKATGIDTDRLTPMGAVPVSLVDGRLIGTMPDGSSYPLLEFFAKFLSAIAMNAFRAVASQPHTPRITIGRMVCFRETWRTTVGDLSELTAVRGEPEQYLAGRRVRAAMGLPERCFVKISTEVKPIYVDFTSPLYVASLCTMLRAALESGGPATAVTLSEMLPTPDQTWVPDSQGRTYFGELRIHLTDPELAQTLVD